MSIDSTPWIDAISSIKEYFESMYIARHVTAGAMSPDNYDLSEMEEPLIITSEDGTSKELTMSGAIFIIRNQETVHLKAPNGFNPKPGIISLYIECWVRSDTTDPIDGYIELSRLEAKTIHALNEWSIGYENTMDKSFDLVDANITQVIGDGDSRRPFLGSRMVFEIQYSLP